uniref:Complex 1 LYR protein domain-containing protein n=1 Tax=Haptolina brevifila TaxID=156173 RepID=A0A7S2JEG3_9EUKA|mmetsp:Transcript_81091/g.161214  ORF Transcript_81091/g.161214 Transcript_81091/m.161214 type:complete len:126 (+) Transcript_81091:46-423(+)
MWRSLASRVAGGACSRSVTPVAGIRSRSSALGAVEKPTDISTLKLYRDCMRLTYHIAAQSAKGEQMRQMIRSSFKAQMAVTDTEEIGRLKMLAIVGLQNYVIHEQTGRAVEKRRRDHKSSSPSEG